MQCCSEALSGQFLSSIAPLGYILPECLGTPAHRTLFHGPMKIKKKAFTEDNCDAALKPNTLNLFMEDGWLAWSSGGVYTLLKTFKGSDFQSHIFRNILGKILPDCSPV